MAIYVLVKQIPKWARSTSIASLRAKGPYVRFHDDPLPVEHDVDAPVKPTIARLVLQRQALFDTTEKQLRLKMGGAAAAGLVLGWLLMDSLIIGLMLMAGGAVFALLMLAPMADETARQETKHAILDVMAKNILGLTSVAPKDRLDVLPKSLIDGWRLLPPLRVVTVDDRLVGQRNGCHVALSRVGFQFGGSANVELKQGDGLVFVIVEIVEQSAPERCSDALAVILGSDAPLMLRSAPVLSHGLREAKTGDEEFDARYAVFGDPNFLPSVVREVFGRLEAVTRCDLTGTRQVPAGTGLRPSVIIRPGHLVVLTPVALFDGALEPPPFWQPLIADTLIVDFASDLLTLNGHLTAAMALRDRLSSTLGIGGAPR